MANNDYQEERINKLVAIFVAYETGPARDAGWHAPSRIETTDKSVTTKSAALSVHQLTASFSQADLRGGNDRADDKAINECRYLQNKHYDYGLAEMLLYGLPEKYANAILAGPVLQSIYKNSQTEARIAFALEISVRQYRHNRGMAFKNIGKALAIVDKHSAILQRTG